MDKEEIQLKTILSPILKSMTYQLTKDKPLDIVSYMISYLQKNYGYTPSNLTFQEKTELDSLRRELFYLKLKEELSPSQPNKILPPININKIPIDDDKNKEETIQFYKKIKSKPKRFSISAEVFDYENKIDNYTPKKYPKTQEEISFIKPIIISLFVFKNLKKDELNEIINCFELKKYEENQIIQEEKQKDNNFYIVKYGELDCFKKSVKFEKNNQNFVKKKYKGDHFGELNLLYNSENLYTIKSYTNSALYYISQKAFNWIIKRNAIIRYKEIEKILKSIDVFSVIKDNKQIELLCDNIKSFCYKKDDVIIREGEYSQSIYIVENGECCSYNGNNNNKSNVYYKNNDFFGASAFIDGKGINKSTVTVCSDYADIICFDNISFNRLLGDIKEMIKKNKKLFDKYCKEDDLILKKENKGNEFNKEEIVNQNNKENIAENKNDNKKLILLNDKINLGQSPQKSEDEDKLNASPCLDNNNNGNEVNVQFLKEEINDNKIDELSENIHQNIKDECNIVNDNKEQNENKQDLKEIEIDKEDNNILLNQDPDHKIEIDTFNNDIKKENDKVSPNIKATTLMDKININPEEEQSEITHNNNNLISPNKDKISINSDNNISDLNINSNILKEEVEQTSSPTYIQNDKTNEPLNNNNNDNNSNNLILPNDGNTSLIPNKNITNLNINNKESGGEVEQTRFPSNIQNAETNENPLNPDINNNNLIPPNQDNTTINPIMNIPDLKINDNELKEESEPTKFPVNIQNGKPNENPLNTEINNFKPTIEDKILMENNDNINKETIKQEENKDNVQLDIPNKQSLANNEDKSSNLGLETIGDSHISLNQKKDEMTNLPNNIKDLDNGNKDESNITQNTLPLFDNIILNDGENLSFDYRKDLVCKLNKYYEESIKNYTNDNKEIVDDSTKINITEETENKINNIILQTNKINEGTEKTKINNNIPPSEVNNESNKLCSSNEDLKNLKYPSPDVTEYINLNRNESEPIKETNILDQNPLLGSKLSDQLNDSMKIIDERNIIKKNDNDNQQENKNIEIKDNDSINKENLIEGEGGLNNSPGKYNQTISNDELKNNNIKIDDDDDENEYYDLNSNNNQNIKGRNNNAIEDEINYADIQNLNNSNDYSNNKSISNNSEPKIEEDNNSNRDSNEQKNEEDINSNNSEEKNEEGNINNINMGKNNSINNSNSSNNNNNNGSNNNGEVE